MNATVPAPRGDQAAMPDDNPVMQKLAQIEGMLQIALPTMTADINGLRTAYAGLDDRLRHVENEQAAAKASAADRAAVAVLAANDERDRDGGRHRSQTSVAIAAGVVSSAVLIGGEAFLMSMRHG